MDSKKRPTSVTVIAWIILASNGITMVCMPLASTMPEVQDAYEKMGMSVAVAMFWVVVGGAIGIASAIAMLNGLNWGRLLYLIFSPISIVLGWIIYGFRPSSIPSVIVYIVFLLFLMGPDASKYFGGRVSAIPEIKEPEPEGPVPEELILKELESQEPEPKE